MAARDRAETLGGAGPLVGRRTLVGGGLAGLAAAGLLPPGAGEALAAPSDPGAGPRVTPDPIRAAIRKSGLAVRLVDFSAPPRSEAKPPYALLNFLYHAGDGSGRLFTNDSRGKIWIIDRATGAATPFLDVGAVRAGSFLKRTRQQGLRSFAFHPDFARAGAPGHRRLFTIATETVASRPAGVRVFGGPFTPVADNVLAEWSVDPANPSRADPASRREILRIAQHRQDHGTDQLMFDPNARPGDASYGMLYFASGDGGRTEPGDQFNLAQDKGQAQGKLLRIDPLRQPDGGAYRAPADNPFVGQAGALPELWAVGLRHPQNLCFDPGGDGAFILSDIGHSNVEEINIAARGANYGWPLREGTFVTDRATGSRLYALPTDDAARGFTYPVAQYDHSEGKAVAGGFVYRGSAVPDLVGHYLFGDIVNGRVFHLPVSELVPGRQATVRELTLLRGRTPVTLMALVGRSSQPPNRVDLRFGQDEAGEVYLLTKQDGRIRRLAAD